VGILQGVWFRMSYSVFFLKENGSVPAVVNSFSKRSVVCIARYSFSLVHYSLPGPRR